MCRKKVDIQSATAEIRRGIKKEETGQKYNVRICYAGRPYQTVHVSVCTAATATTTLLLLYFVCV